MTRASGGWWSTAGWLWLLVCVSCGGSSTPTGAESADGESVGDDKPTCPDLSSCEEACTLDDAAGCEFAGRMYETGEGATQDYAKAAKLYDKACRGGREGACSHLAMMYDIGLAVDEDPERAHELYEKACAQGNSWACKRGEQLEH
jgi:uncharacterized protein